MYNCSYFLKCLTGNFLEPTMTTKATSLQIQRDYSM